MPRHQGGAVSSVTQRYALDDEPRLGGLVVDVETAHAAFQFDVHRGDVAQYLGGSAAGHHERTCECSPCGFNWWYRLVKAPWLSLLLVDGSGGGVGFRTANRGSNCVIYTL